MSRFWIYLKVDSVGFAEESSIGSEREKESGVMSVSFRGLIRKCHILCILFFMIPRIIIFKF